MEEIVNFVYGLLEYTEIEIEETKNMYDYIFSNQELITEKNIGKSYYTEDNYNIGNYYISKEKDADVSLVFWPKHFIEKYITDENDKKIIEFIKKNKISTDVANNCFILYNNLKLRKIKNNTKNTKNINDYII